MASLLPSLVSCWAKLWVWSLAREIGRGCLQVFSKIESGRTLGRGSIVGGKPCAAERGRGSQRADFPLSCRGSFRSGRAADSSPNAALTLPQIEKKKGSALEICRIAENS